MCTVIPCLNSRNSIVPFWFLYDSILEPNTGFHFEIPKISFLLSLTIYSQIQLTILAFGITSTCRLVRATPITANLQKSFCNNFHQKTKKGKKNESSKDKWR